MTDNQQALHAKFKALIKSADPRTAMTHVSASAAAGCWLVTWLGTNGQSRRLRVNPFGLDLEEVVAEFAAQCIAAAALPGPRHD